MLLIRWNPFSVLNKKQQPRIRLSTQNTHNSHIYKSTECQLITRAVVQKQKQKILENCVGKHGELGIKPPNRDFAGMRLSVHMYTGEPSWNCIVCSAVQYLKIKEEDVWGAQRRTNKTIFWDSENKFEAPGTYTFARKIKDQSGKLC